MGLEPPPPHLTGPARGWTNLGTSSDPGKCSDGVGGFDHTPPVEIEAALANKPAHIWRLGPRLQPKRSPRLPTVRGALSPRPGHRAR